MKKDKKIIKKNTAKIIFLYGYIAVGKFTIAKILKKKLGYKLFHNHSLIDLVDGIFERDTYARNLVLESFRYQLLENAAKAGINLIVTHTYVDKYITPTGLTDSKYVQTLSKKLNHLGAKFCPVYLYANNTTLLNRVAMNSRKKFKKLVDKKIMKKILLEDGDLKNAFKFKHGIFIDNTNMSPNKVADIIVEHFKLT